MTVKRGRTKAAHAYWDIQFKPIDNLSEQDASDMLIDRLKTVTSKRLVSDVPLGAFLSGGVDSSAIVAMMAGASADPINTFSISFGNKAFDESAYAQEVAERYATKHVTRQLDPDEFSVLDQLGAIYDEPFGDSSAMPTYRVCAEARKFVTVCLSGDGGDELFAGYRRYLWHQREADLRRLLPDGLRRPLFGFLGSVYPKLDWAPRFLRAKTTFQELSMDDDDAFFHSVSVTTDGLRQTLFSSKMASELQTYHARNVLLHHMRQAQTDEPLIRAQYADLKTWLAGGILTKVDRASMAASLEVRAPLLDHELAEWAVNLSPKYKLQGKTGKYLLKRALEPHISSGILYRPKQGFSMPIAQWFRQDLRARVRDSVLGTPLLDTGLFDRTALTRLVDEHQSGMRDHSPVLWLLLMFDSFLKLNTLSE